MKSGRKLYNIPLVDAAAAQCTLIGDKSLEMTKGMETHKVDLINEKAVSETDTDELKHIVQSTGDSGHEVTTVKKQYPVSGMTCASCAGSVESIINSQPGVEKAGVNMATQTIQVEYNPTIIDPATMKQALQAVGYDMMIEDTDDAKEDLEKQHRESYINLKNRTRWAVGLSVPLVMVGMLFMHWPYANYLMWALSTPIVLWLGRNFFVNAWKQARNRSANMDTLVALSTGIAYIFSVFNTLNPSFWQSRGLTAHVYFEAAGVVITFILLGKLLNLKPWPHQRSSGSTGTR